MTTSSINRIVIGESFGHHDGAVSIIHDAAQHEHALWTWSEHTERFTGIKHDKRRHPEHNVHNAKHFKVERAFYERPMVANARRWLNCEKLGPRPLVDHYIEHHWAHAASAYYTRPWDDSIEPVCVVIDAIGEWDTASIWFKKQKVWSLPYPKSLGLFYAAVTQACGFVPNRDEHLVMALSAYGDYQPDLEDFFLKIWDSNLHKGFTEADLDTIRMHYSREDIARAGQYVLTKQILLIMDRAKHYSNHLCYSGGVALNCVANSAIMKTGMFDDIWIFPNPGDAGASFGAAAAVVDKRIKFYDNFKGHFAQRKVAADSYSTNRIAVMVNELMSTGVVGISNGCGEFGPRALGNRSFIGVGQKGAAKIREIKGRPVWSPLAPAILEENFDEYFIGPKNAHMSFVAQAKTKTLDAYPEIVHRDYTARVQCVPDTGTQLRKILERLDELHGIKMVINTSLNMRHRPMPSKRLSKLDEIDLLRYDVKVF